MKVIDYNLSISFTVWFSMLSLTGRSDSVLPCCGNKEHESHAVTCHAGKDVQVYERLFSMKEVSRHCDSQSCWVVVDNVVYDLTEFQYEVRVLSSKKTYSNLHCSSFI